jgi:hypothetical protein
VNVTPEELAAIKERAAEVAADTHWWNTAIYEVAGQDVPALLAEVERLRSALTDIGKAAEERSNGLSGAWVFERVCAALGLPGSHSFWLTPEQQDAVIRRLQVAH